MSKKNNNKQIQQQQKDTILLYKTYNFYSLKRKCLKDQKKIR